MSQVASCGLPRYSKAGYEGLLGFQLQQGQLVSPEDFNFELVLASVPLWAE